MKLQITVNGSVYDVDVDVEEEPPPTLGAVLVGRGSSSTSTATKVPATSANALASPVAGTVVTVLVEAGSHVTSGQTLLVLEAMKMETEVTASKDGTVKSVEVVVGDAVQGGQVLIEWVE